MSSTCSCFCFLNLQIKILSNHCIQTIVNNIKRYFNYSPSISNVPIIVFSDATIWIRKWTKHSEWWILTKIWLKNLIAETRTIAISQSRDISNHLLYRPAFRKSEQRSFRFFSNAKLQDPRFQTDSYPFSPFPGFTKINCFASALSLQLSRRTAPFLNYFLQ